jgi:hypothetical protein
MEPARSATTVPNFCIERHAIPLLQVVTDGGLRELRAQQRLEREQARICATVERR